MSALGGKFAIVFRHRSNLSVRLFCPNTSALTFHLRQHAFGAFGEITRRPKAHIHIINLAHSACV